MQDIKAARELINRMADDSHTIVYASVCLGKDWKPHHGSSTLEHSHPCVWVDECQSLIIFWKHKEGMEKHNKNWEILSVMVVGHPMPKPHTTIALDEHEAMLQFFNTPAADNWEGFKKCRP